MEPNTYPAMAHDWQRIGVITCGSNEPPTSSSALRPDLPNPPDTQPRPSTVQALPSQHALDTQPRPSTVQALPTQHAIPKAKPMPHNIHYPKPPPPKPPKASAVRPASPNPSGIPLAAKPTRAAPRPPDTERDYHHPKLQCCPKPPPPERPQSE